MSIKRTIIAAVVGLTLVALVAPGVAQGVTVEELLAQISQLQAQLNALIAQQGGGTTTGGGTVPSACVGVTFTRALVVGSTGQDVKCAQTLLNTNGYTLSQTGAGSPGMETSYFGPRTLAATRAFQIAKGWAPANQVGPLTRAAFNALITSGTTTVCGNAVCEVGESQSTCPADCTGVVTPTGAGLTVSLASTNPASGAVVDGQAQAPLAKLSFFNGDNAEVNVTQLKLDKIGISADATLANVYLFNGAVRLTDGAAVSSNVISFNDSTGLFKVPAGGMVTITVVADIADSTSGQTVGVQLASASNITTNSSSVNGTFPFTGNLMTVADGTLASVVFHTTTTPAVASVDPQDDYVIFQNSVVVYTRAVDMSRISLRKTGSVTNSDLQNFRLYVDGVQVGSAVQNLDANGYVTFDLTSSPKRMEAGTRVVKVMADIIGGSSLAFTMNLWNAADTTIVDSQYGANILVEADADGTAFSKRSTGEQTINSGVITITKLTDSPTGNIVDGASNATLAKFQVKAAGEAVKIETIKVSVVCSDGGTTADGNVGYLRNGMLLANGVQIGSTSNLNCTQYSTTYTSFSLGSSLIVTPGSPVTLEVKADVYDNDGTDDIGADNTIKVRVEGSSSENNAIGQKSASTIDAPSSDVDGNSLTVSTGSLTLSQYPSYTAQSAVAPVTAYKLAHFTLTANTTEAVNITSITATLDEVSSYTSNLYVVYGNNTTSTKPNISAAANSWSINHTVPAGETIDVMVYCDVSSSMSSGTGIVTVGVDGTTASSATTADSSDVAGQTITFTSGAFATSFASTPQNQVVAGGQTVELGRWKFTSSYENYTIQEIRIDPDTSGASASDNAEDVISSLVLKKTDGTVIATRSWNANGYYKFDGLSLAIPASTTVTVIAEAVLTPYISATAGNSGLRVAPALVYTKYMDSQGTVATPDETARNANSTYVYRTVPTLSKVDLTSSTLVNGAVYDLFSFKVTAPTQGDIYLKQFKIDLAWSDGEGATDNLELESLKLLKNGTDITTLVTIQDEDLGLSAEDATGVTEGNENIIVVWDGDTEDTIPAGSSVIYTIRGTPQGFNVLDAAVYAGSDTVSLSFNADTAAVTFGSTTVDYTGYLNTDDTAQVGSVMSLYTSATASTSAEAAKFIWSDGSAVAHSASTTAGTNDWTNSYLLQDLTSQTWAD